MPLNSREQRFVAEYPVDLNATQAAIRAGYSAKTAKQQGSRLLTRVDVASALAGKQERLERRLEVTKERVINELARIAFADIRSVVQWRADGQTAFTPTDELSKDETAAIEAFTVEKRVIPQKNDTPIEVTTYKVSMHSKIAALNALGKHLGLFTERIDINLVHTLAASMGISAEEVMREAEAILKGKITT